MSCLKSNKTLYGCNARVLFNVYIYRVFVGEEYLALVPLFLPHLRELCLWACYSVVDKYVEELEATVPDLKITKLPSY